MDVFRKPAKHTLEYAPAEPAPRPLLRGLFFVAGALALIPVSLGFAFLFYALGGVEGARGAWWMGIAPTGGGIAWVIGIRWLYRRLMPTGPTPRADAPAP